jgi:cytochrome c
MASIGSGAVRGSWTATLVCALAALAIAAPAADAQAPPDSEFEKVTLNDMPPGGPVQGEPMDLAVLPDGRVLHTTRRGQVWLHDPATGRNTLAAEPEIYNHDEEGLQGIALDPNFEKSKRVYLYYSPPLDTPVDDPVTPVNEGDAPEFGDPDDFAPYEGVVRLSTFKWKKDHLALNTERQIIDVPVDRGICCHVGGDIVFDSDGNLIMSTGDDTNPFESDGYTPIDERPDRNPAFDAQRTAANTNDLRGKILRITPDAQHGGYEIPDGNLFPEGTEGTRPEIYAMGFRNPFRIEINRTNDELYVGDYSPDNGTADPERGPAGHGKWTIVREPGNYGWPYCATAELPYVDGEFVGEPDPSAPPQFISSGEEFDCENPVNESPNNTGLTELPPVTQPDVWYSFGPSAEFPELGTGGVGPMGGPAYDFDPAKASPPAWPEYFDGVPLFYEWTRDYAKEFRLDAAGNLAEISPATGSLLGTLGPARGDDATFDNAMDLEFGPDGALYTVEYGDGFFVDTPEAQLARIDYIGPGGNHAPQVQASGDPDAGLEAPLTVEFSSAGTSDPDGDELSFEWYLDDDDKVDSTEANPTFTYKKEGVYLATLKATDEHGRSASTFVTITVGNQQPEVELTTTPAPGEPFSFGDPVSYQVEVTDEEAIDCDQVQVNYLVGHDDHSHGQSITAGCEGTIQTTLPTGHEPGEITAVFSAEYTDSGGLVGTDQVVLEPSE